MMFDEGFTERLRAAVQQQHGVEADLARDVLITAAKANVDYARRLTDEMGGSVNGSRLTWLFQQRALAVGRIADYLARLGLERPQCDYDQVNRELQEIAAVKEDD